MGGTPAKRPHVAKSTSVSEPAPPPQRIRVLIVDDDPQAAALLEPALHDAPFEVQVDTAPNYTIGLRRIQANEHDVYLIDYRLPDGTDTALIHEAKIAGIEKPFILITGNGSGRVDEVALTEGAADYIEKDQLEKYLSRSIR